MNGNELNSMQQTIGYKKVKGFKTSGFSIDFIPDLILLHALILSLEDYNWIPLQRS